MSVTVVKREFDKKSLRYALEEKNVPEMFVPACFMRVNRGAKEALRKLPLTYVFVRTTERGVAEIKKALPTLKLNAPISVATGQRKHVTLHDGEMRMFRKIADVFGGQLPCYPAGAFDVESCDRVRIVADPFAGVEGAMVPSQGRDGGLVVLPMRDLFFVSVGEQSPHNYKVLEFGKGSRHPYHEFDNYLPRVTDALRQRLTTGGIDDGIYADVAKFVHRYSELSARTLNIESMYCSLMLMSYAALDEDREAWLGECKRLLPRLTADLQRALHQAMMYAATGDATLARQLHGIVAEWGEIAAGDRKKRTVVALLTEFESLYAIREALQIRV